MAVIKNLQGVFTGSGFSKKKGRRINFEDCGYINGPVDIHIDESTGSILDIAQNITIADTPYYDASGLVATPGFIDSHTHLLFAGDRSQEYFMRWQGKSYVDISEAGGGIHNTVRQSSDCDPQDLLNGCLRKLANIFKSGTTTIEVKSGYADNSSDELHSLAIIKQLKDSSPHNVYSTFLGLHALPKGKTEASFVDEMIAALPDAKNKYAIDFVDCFPEVSFFSLEQALRFTDKAQELGLRLKIHADELTDLGSSLEYIKRNASSIDHLQKISDEAIQALAESATVATMLPATSFYLGLEYAKARQLIEAGAQVALATDYNPGTAPSSSMGFTQLLAASQMKLQPEEILCASTYNAAAALNIEDSHGTLTENKRADIVLWQLQNIKPEKMLCELFVNSLTPVTVFKAAIKIT